MPKRILLYRDDGKQNEGRHDAGRTGKAGIDREWTKRLHAPIGLKIGAQTPEEIAVSVMAEILQERSKAGCSMKTGYEVFRHALENIQEGERFVLSTILERRGSAPRKEGTHFIVSESGNCFGTIGGGKLEADIVRASQEMMKQGEDWRIEESDLNNRDAADEGLVCGGHVKVLMETGKTDRKKNEDCAGMAQSSLVSALPYLIFFKCERSVGHG